MTRLELVEKLAETTQLSRAAAERALDGIMKIISSELSSGNEIRLVGFGRFTTVTTKERKGRNPATGEPITIPSKRVVKFIPGKALKEAVTHPLP